MMDAGAVSACNWVCDAAAVADEAALAANGATHICEVHIMFVGYALLRNTLFNV